jgi:hypothetical protein
MRTFDYDRARCIKVLGEGLLNLLCELLGSSFPLFHFLSMSVDVLLLLCPSFRRIIHLFLAGIEQHCSPQIYHGRNQFRCPNFAVFLQTSLAFRLDVLHRFQSGIVKPWSDPPWGYSAAHMLSRTVLKIGIPSLHVQSGAICCEMRGAVGSVPPGSAMRP